MSHAVQEAPEERQTQPIDKIWARLSSSDKVLFLGHANKTLTESERARFQAICARQSMTRR